MSIKGGQFDNSQLISLFEEVRAHTSYLCEPLEIEDFVVQPVIDVSPLKWHLAHTTWFFETFVLKPFFEGYQVFHPKYALLFNSYYVAAGDRWTRAKRGQLTRPTVSEIFEYRRYVEQKVLEFMSTKSVSMDAAQLVFIGTQHEQQHQELLLYDIKRILGDNPLQPVYRKTKSSDGKSEIQTWLKVEEGIYSVGFEGEGFHFDNEKGVHKVFLEGFEIADSLVSNGEYLEFVTNGGYQKHEYWLSEGWDWLQIEKVECPRYWELSEDGTWGVCTLGGYEELKMHEPVCHVSYYEAAAFAKWKKCRLPTEFEWEVACKKFAPEIPNEANFVGKQIWKPIYTGTGDFYGNVWEWTSSPYLPYPYFQEADGALGEYNGKFMINQMVLRGGSFATPKNHIRPTYRNFFHPHLRWLFGGFRLAKYS